MDRPTLVEKQRWVELYKAHTIMEISQLTGRAVNTVRKGLVELGVNVRMGKHPRGAPRGRQPSRVRTVPR